MAQVELRDEHGNKVELTDAYGNPVWLTDEKGNPVHIKGVATIDPKCFHDPPQDIPHSNTSSSSLSKGEDEGGMKKGLKNLPRTEKEGKEYSQTTTAMTDCDVNDHPTTTTTTTNENEKKSIIEIIKEKLPGHNN